MKELTILFQDNATELGSDASSAKGASAKVEIVVAESLQDLYPYAGDIETLANESFEKNVFYEPMLLFPGLRHCGKHSRLKCLLIFTQSKQNQRRLCGFFPLEEKDRYRGIPVRHLIFWASFHTCLVTPLIHADFTRLAWEGLIAWFHSQPQYKLLFAGLLGAEGQLYEDLIKTLEDTDTTFFSDQYKRPALEPAEDAESYFSLHTSRNFRKTVKRKTRQLQKHGPISYRVLETEQELEQWLDMFVTLECSGWKGQRGYPIAHSEGEHRFFLESMREAHRRGRLLIMGLFLKERPIAMLINLASKEISYAFKVAHDEQYARHSPGVLLDFEMIRHIHRSGSRLRLDACSDRGMPAYERLFNSDRRMHSLAIANDNLLAKAIVKLLPSLRRRKYAGSTTP